MTDSLYGTSAVVTGGASGLGCATANRLADRGAQVVIVDLDSRGGAEIAETRSELTFVAADVTDEQELIAAVARASELGVLRTAVACAGVASAKKVLGRSGVHGLADFERVIGVNLIGTFNMVRLAAQAMAASEPSAGGLGDDGGRGVIIMTASIAAYEGQVGQAAYSASKGGIIGLTLPLARDLAEHGIRVMSIAPGIFDTPLLAALPDTVRESLESQVPFPPRFGMSEEFADLVSLIIDNPYLNGETIRLDGAIRLTPQ